ncbi:ketopantoate reductase family protein [Mitsuaria sp. 7]|uniref:ketopantoate reductase family protein n=1 Tax=Mitsuaria sp. 7 TaxID=1658665 RepID=UPI0007DDF5C0|nr:2-dehydropantoate 2-reductase [Mitsuaria sp. 7]ANH70414.1 hypothetical protein ABE85_09970 [Mitsuaria sp. 7]
MTTGLRVCVVGPGAVGGLLAHSLLDAGIATSLLAHQRREQQIRTHGLVLVEPGGKENVKTPRVVGRASELGEQDVVFLCTKSIALPSLAPTLAPLIGPGTLIVSLMNGIPWWFFGGRGGDGSPLRLQSVDPDGAVSRALPPAQCLGCVVYLSSSLDAHGRVVPGAERRLIVGAPDGGNVDGAEAVAALLRHARFQVSTSGNIRREVWAKLWGNLALNPTSALTLATTDELLGSPLTRRLIENLMREAQQVGERIGIDIGMTVAERIAATQRLGAFKTSMLQDVESGRPLEVDTIVRSVSEIAQHVGVEVPFIDTILGLVALRNRGLVERRSRH